MSKGTSTTTQSADPWSGIQPYLLDAFSQLSQTQAPTYFPGSTVAPQSSNTTQGVNALAGSAQGQQQIADTAQQGFNFTMNDMLNPATNQYLQQTASAAINPIYDKLQKDILPGIQGGAVQAGQFGGTAQRNLTDTALTNANREAFDATGKIYSDAYNNSLNNYTQTLLGSPLVQSTQAAPGQTQLSAGGVTDAYQQQLTNDEVARYNQGQTGQFDYLTQYINTLLGQPQGSTTTQQGGGPSPVAGGLSGAALGYGLTGALGLSNPWLLPLMLGGGGALSA